MFKKALCSCLFMVLSHTLTACWWETELRQQPLAIQNGCPIIDPELARYIATRYPHGHQIQWWAADGSTWYLTLREEPELARGQLIVNHAILSDQLQLRPVFSMRVGDQHGFEIVLSIPDRAMPLQSRSFARLHITNFILNDVPLVRPNEASFGQQTSWEWAMKQLGSR